MVELPPISVSLRGQVIALACVGAATLVRYALGLVEPGIVPFAGYFLAIIISTWKGDVAAGASSLVLGGAAAWLLFMGSPIFRAPSLAEALNLMLFGAAGCLIIYVTHKIVVASAKIQKGEEDLAQSNSRLQAIYESSSEGLTFCKLLRDARGAVIDYVVLDVNPAHARLTGVPREEMVDRRVTVIRPPINSRWISSAEETARTRQPVSFEVQSPVTKRWLDIRFSPISGDYFAQTFIDVSDRHRIEEQRRTLFDEMNHRVKNNFQMISSLLYLQASRIADADAKSHLMEAVRRVSIMANLHSMLSDGDADRTLEFGAFLKAVCGQLRASIEEPHRISLQVMAEPCWMPAEKVLPLAFAVNEMVTNSVKYAFPDARSGEISVRFEKGLRPHEYVLTVRDNGQGMGEAADRSNGLGSRLIHAFAEQVGGRLSKRDEDGVCYSITLQMNEPCKVKEAV